jgi:zinc transport system permease protein
MLDVLGFEFMRNAILAGILASVACGLVGVYVVVKRIVGISGGIAHASFGGIGLGYYLAISPVLGAMFFSLLSAVTMGLVTRKTRIAEDTAIGILWAVGMALGVILIGLTPGYAPDLMSYLFGNILTVPASDLLLMLGLDIVILAVIIAFYKEFLILSFDEEFGEVSGMPVNALYLLLLCLVALTVVVLIRVVGMILVIALLTFPAVLARRFSHDLKKMMLLAILIGVFFSLGGLWLSYQLNLASGATIILFGGVMLGTVFGLTGISRLRKKRSGANVTEN